jgi:hypothetical protein
VADKVRHRQRRRQQSGRHTKKAVTCFLLFLSVVDSSVFLFPLFLFFFYSSCFSLSLSLSVPLVSLLLLRFLSCLFYERVYVVFRLLVLTVTTSNVNKSRMCKDVGVLSSSPVVVPVIVCSALEHNE